MHICDRSRHTFLLKPVTDSAVDIQQRIPSANHTEPLDPRYRWHPTRTLTARQRGAQHRPTIDPRSVIANVRKAPITERRSDTPPHPPPMGMKDISTQTQIYIIKVVEKKKKKKVQQSQGIPFAAAAGWDLLMRLLQQSAANTPVPALRTICTRSQRVPPGFNGNVFPSTGMRWN